MTKTLLATLVTVAAVSAILSATAQPERGKSPVAESVAESVAATGPQQPVPVGHPTFVSPHAAPIAAGGKHVFVANTQADTLDVIDRTTRKIVARVDVGIDPVSVAVRPDGKEVWVSNHVSDSVSVIDTDPKSASYLHVVATVQQFDPKTKATRFDEPMSIAFAGNDKAYVALSSENVIAVIDVDSRKVVKRLTITAQDPRAITVRNGRLYVIPFESNNKTQLSGGSKIDGDLVTFNAWEHSIRVNNVLSLGHVVDIVKHPRVPDRDLYVFDTKTDKLVKTVDTLGTLLYGLAVDSRGRVFIAQTDARNDANGRAGTKKHGLAEMNNRAFLNRITQVEIKPDGTAGKPKFIDLEPLPPKHPQKGEALATPFAIQVSDDDSTLVVSAAASDKLFTVDTATGKILGRVSVGTVPRGIALESADGKPAQAWVLNAVENSVSLVDVSNAKMPQVVATIPLQDPTHPAVKRGRIAFNTAAASTTGTFACASCHPDGHTDQLLWVLKTPIVSGGNQIMPRSTMPIRGLRDTAPYHWDGIPGDPYGGINSASIHRSVKPNSRVDDPASTTRHLIDGGLAATMHLEGDARVNDEDKLGELSAKERDDMATFLLSVPYPPAQRRAYDNVVSNRARDGFRLFHIEGDNDPGKRRPNVCGNCHRMPFLVSTNTPGTGMDAPTWRGAYDRFLILPQGRLNIIDFDFYRRAADAGQSEKSIWQFSWGGRRRFNPVWDMVLEGSTGCSGTFARQITLSKQTVDRELTGDLLDALETSAKEGAVVLETEGVITAGGKPAAVKLQYRGGKYIQKAAGTLRRAAAAGKKVNDNAYTREALVALAKSGKFVGTFTARHGVKSDVEHPQPAVWTLGPLEKQSGRQRFPTLYAGKQSMTVSGRHIDRGAHVVVDGRRVPGKVTLKKNEQVVIVLAKLPAEGMHLMQLQNPDGLFSNDFIFHVAKDAEAAAELKRKLDAPHVNNSGPLARAIARGDLEATKRILGRGAKVNARNSDGGATPLSTAALYGRYEIARHLIERGANVKASNSDGNTPLHVAAFLCREKIVRLLLEKGASPKTKNRRGETPIGVVSGAWSKQLADFYTGIGRSAGVKISLKQIETDRPRMAGLLQEHVKKPE